MIDIHTPDDRSQYDAIEVQLDYLIDVNYEDKIYGRLKRAISGVGAAATEANVKSA